MKKLKVLIVDDSALVRRVLEDLLSTDPELEVVGTANDPFVAVDRMRNVTPDVLVLDVEMPRMDGVTFLKKVMLQHPIPTVICSTLVREGTETAIAALEAGAVELIEKPVVGTKQFLEESRVRLCDAIKAAGRASLRRAQRAPFTVAPKVSADAVLPLPAKPMIRTTQRVIVVGASTGGTEALRILLSGMTIDCPGIVIVQHMPEGFTGAFARRLNDLLPIEVKEAVDGESVLAGRALIARGDHHLVLQRSGARYFVQVTRGPLVSRHRPSVDVLFRSAAASAGRNALGVILTGMGDDGAQGMLEMKQAGARTFAQNEETCIVYGMPAEAVKRGAVDHVLPLQAIAGAVMAGARS